jgi:hypothetical protein
MEEEKYKYLIRYRGNNYYQGGAVYSGHVGTAILDKLPSWISENGDASHEVFRSDKPKFKEILIKELVGKNNQMGLESQIENDEWQLLIKKKNRDLIVGALNEIGKGN